MPEFPVSQYTAIADAEMEALLARALAGIRTELSELPPYCRPEYVYLGGGYGRGEGGVSIRSDGRKSLYNDLDLFVFVTRANARRRRAIDAALQEISERWSAVLELEVDFPPCRNLSGLTNFEGTLMFQELLQGYQLIYGQNDCLAEWPRRPATEIPPLEAYRLMLNRGSGILLAAERLLRQPQPGSDERDFALRNLHKAVLGCGDALLLQQKRYHYRSQEREKQLCQNNPLPDSELPKLYALGRLYKARPVREPDGDLSPFWRQVRQLWQDSLLTLLKLNRPKDNHLNSKEIQAALLSLRKQSPQSVSRQALRWLRYTRQLFPMQNLPCHPILRTLAELCPLLLENHLLEDYSNKRFFCASPSYPAFLQLWRFFN